MKVSDGKFMRTGAKGCPGECSMASDRGLTQGQQPEEAPRGSQMVRRVGPGGTQRELGRKARRHE